MAPVIEILNESTEPPDRPSDCALTVALPLDRESFLRQLEEGPDENFARSFRGPQRLKLANHAVYLIYEKYVDLANKVIRSAENLGVTVMRNVRLSDFASIVQTHRVTTIFAHSRDAHFYESDIVDPELVSDELNRANSAIRQAIRELGGPEPLELKQGTGSDRDQIVACLNKIIDGICGAIPQTGATEGRVGEITRRHLNWSRRRKALQHSLPSGFRGGDAIEFSGSFVSIDAILETIPATFEGKLDLTSCNSTVFAEDVRRKCKSVLVIANEDSTSLDLRFAIYRQVIQRLSRRSEPYEDALYRIRRELI